jgi:hypothetical protein
MAPNHQLQAFPIPKEETLNMMKKIAAGLLAGAAMIALAGCGDDTPTAQARAEVASTLQNAPSRSEPVHQTQTIIGPDGNTIQCVSYGGGFCVQR